MRGAAPKRDGETRDLNGAHAFFILNGVTDAPWSRTTRDWHPKDEPLIL